MQKLKILKTIEEVTELLNYLEDKTFVAFDTETTGLDRQSEIVGISVSAEESIGYYIILSSWNKEKQTLEYLPTRELIPKLLKDLTCKSLIMHNGMFDCTLVKANFNIDLMPHLHTDTMILAHLLNEEDGVGLKEVGSRLFGESAKDEALKMKESVLANGGEWLKSNKEMYKADVNLLAEYGAKDAILTYRIFLELVPKLYEENLDKFFYEEECMPLLRGPTYDLNTKGLLVDADYLRNLKKQLQVDIEEAHSFVQETIKTYVQEKYPGIKPKTTFNIGSSSQMAWLLFGKMGLEPAGLTKEGKNVQKFFGLKSPYSFKQKRDYMSEVNRNVGRIYVPEVIINGKKSRAKKIREVWHYLACGQEELELHQNEHEWIKRLVEYNKKSKLLSTYLEGIENRMKYGIIQPSFNQTGTTSGRYSSSNPNFQNLPREEKRIKKCIIPRKGKVFVGADYSQLEPRVFAYLSGDTRLLESFQGEDDFYSVIGMEVWEKSDCTPRKDGSPEAFGIKYKHLRDMSKTIALASTYGATAWQLAPVTGKSIKDTQEDIDSYFEKFPSVKKFMVNSHEQGKQFGRVVNIFGRPRRIPAATRITTIYGDKPHGELPYEARKLLNLSVNHRVQSTGASIVNRAAIALYNRLKALNLKANIVVQVHDSLVVECNEKDANIVSKEMQEAMENTVVLPGIKLEASPKIGYNLAEV